MDWQVSITQTPKKPQRMLAPITISCWFTPRSPGAERGELLTGTVFCAVLYIFWLRAYALAVSPQVLWWPLFGYQKEAALVPKRLL